MHRGFVVLHPQHLLRELQMSVGVFYLIIISVISKGGRVAENYLKRNVDYVLHYFSIHRYGCFVSHH